MDLRFHPAVENAASSSILITGAARSGTTIIGKIISTCVNVEYFFEPESLICLYASRASVSDSVYKSLYTSLLIEHLGLNSIAGRNLNRNSNDDSAADFVKDAADLQARLSKSWRRIELLEELPNHHFAFKIPSILQALPSHALQFPDSKPIIVTRKPIAIYRSIKSKGWFVDSAVPLLSPFLMPLESRPDVFIPYWVGEDFKADWAFASEVQRFVYYYRRMYEAAISLPPSSAVYLDYDHLVRDPRRLVTKLFGLLGIDSGAKTEAVLKTIRPRLAVSVDDLSSSEVDALDQLHSLHANLLTLSL